MQRRNLDFDVPVSREQWDQIGRTAAALSPDGSGLKWKANEPEVIHVFVRDEDAPGALRDHVVPEHRDGRHEREVARFVFNDGRPYAELEGIAAPDEPTITEQQEQAMRREIEGWVRNKWHGLLDRSGVTSVRGHLPTE